MSLSWSGPQGKVTRTFPDSHGIVSTVEVQEGKENYLRPLEFIVPLELAHEESYREGPMVQELTDQLRQMAAVLTPAMTSLRKSWMTLQQS